MFDYMLKENGNRLRGYFSQLMEDFNETDLTFIKELIDVPIAMDNEVRHILLPNDSVNRDTLFFNYLYLRMFRE